MDEFIHSAQLSGMGCYAHPNLSQRMHRNMASALKKRKEAEQLAEAAILDSLKMGSIRLKEKMAALVA